MLLILAEVGHIKTEGSGTSRELFFKPWLLCPLGKCSSLGTQDLEGIQFPEGAQKMIVPLLPSMENTPFLPLFELSRKRAAQST